MRSSKYIFYLTLLLIIACRKQVHQSVLEKNISEFDTLILNCVLDVELIPDTFNFISIQSHSTILKNLDIEVSKGNLSIKNNFRGNFLMPNQSKIFIKLHTNGLSKIIVNQTCFVHNTVPFKAKEIGLVMAGKVNEVDLVLDCETFYYWNNFPCGGKLKLTGQVKYLKLWNGALMGIDAQSLKSEIALVENNARADCKINCTNQFTGKLTGAGNILLWGKPSTILLQAQSGEGKLIQQD